MQERVQMLLMSEEKTQKELSDILNEMVEMYDERVGNLWPEVKVYIIDDMEPEE